MENASKALIIAGSILITILLIAVAVYVFNQGKTMFRENADKSSVEVQSFNAKFTTYQTNWEYGLVISDDTARYQASNILNNISDVISAANLASSVNYQNNYGYSYYDSRDGYVETINAVEVIIDLNGYSGSDLKKYYLIEPNKDVNSDCVYGADSISDLSLNAGARAARISSFNTSNETSCNTLLKALSETKLVTYNNSKYTLYRYYFKGEYSMNETNSKIDSLKFTLVYDRNFNSL